MEPKYATHILKQLIFKHGQHRHMDALQSLQIPAQAYTVIGIWADQQQPWMAHVNAETPDKAAAKGIRQTYNKGKNGGELEDLFVVEVIAGTHMGLMDNQPDTTVSLKDLAAKVIVVRHKGKVCPACNGKE
jgi:hypothetical protein